MPAPATPWIGPVEATASTWCYATPEEREWWGGMWADRILGSALAHQLERDGFATRTQLQDISVEMVDDYLTLSGSRKAFGADGKETESAEFSRSITIPESVQADKIAAAYENGVLTVTLPKREEAKPRKITVEVK